MKRQQHKDISPIVNNTKQDYRPVNVKSGEFKNKDKSK